ncbi:hypothetical protein PF010_g24415 [Phytophthora fragariae]|uniref:SnoaL-like domain-containing protein n=2 Tax=Phytophthora fragariae TaxID=53985 RepID=A0A6G0K3K3_9STRA|nr:hypothetical protein PF010_g24415 [Phytophthora fragariae]
MGLLQLLTAVVVALIVFIDGIASTTNEISATESSVLQNKQTISTVDFAFFAEAAAFLDKNDLMVGGAAYFGLPSTELIDLGLSPFCQDKTEKLSQSTRLRREKEAFRRQKQRQRRKAEREGLEQEALELSQQLKRLKQGIESNAGTCHASVQLSNYYWRDCAAKQRGEREKAESEQKRLVAAKEAQATYIDHLTKMTQSRPEVLTLAGEEGEHKLRRVGDSDDAMFAALLQDVEACYARIDDSHRECDMDNMPIGITNSVHRGPNGEVDFFQHVNRFMQPFEFQDMFKSSWKLAGHPHRTQDRQEYQGAAGLDDTIAVKFRLTRTLATGTKVSVLQRLVVRRFIENDRIFHVWKVYSEGEGILRGMHSDETSWCRFRPTPDGFGT